MPGSVEAFAQEYGRAGRDGADSWCILLATLPDDEQVGIHLDLTADHLTRKKRHDDRQVRFDYKRAEPGERLSWTQSTDLDHQLFLHYQSFPGVDKETDDARRLLAEVWDGSLEAIGGSIEIDRSRWPGERYGSDTTARAREMALCRLYLLDLVDDYTVQYPYREGGADNFEVQLADFDTYAVDEAIRRRGRDLEPVTLSNAAITTLASFLTFTTEPSNQRAYAPSTKCAGSPPRVLMERNSRHGFPPTSVTAYWPRRSSRRLEPFRRPSPIVRF
jgi:hypothetical protein